MLTILFISYIDDKDMRMILDGMFMINAIKIEAHIITHVFHVTSFVFSAA